MCEGRNVRGAKRGTFLQKFDDLIRDTLQTILNVSLDENTWQQLTFSVKLAGMGISSVTDFAAPACLLSVRKSRVFVESIIARTKSARRSGPLVDIS